MTWQNKLFSFQGRVTRKDYWLYHLGLILGIVALSIGIGLVSTGLGGRDPESPAFVVAAVAFLICLWPFWAVGVKRCHDRGKSGWWYLGWSVGGAIPYVGFLISLWALVELGFLDGTQGANEYGPSPKGIGDTQVADVFS
ncbi:DUF805 domain-containing protein [Labrys miyagiensis]|nr:DUF805 domain-containing protein [Labrys miyagiensis]